MGGLTALCVLPLDFPPGTLPCNSPNHNTITPTPHFGICPALCQWVCTEPSFSLIFSLWSYLFQQDFPDLNFTLGSLSSFFQCFTLFFLISFILSCLFYPKMLLLFYKLACYILNWHMNSYIWNVLAYAFLYSDQVGVIKVFILSNTYYFFVIRKCKALFYISWNAQYMIISYTCLTVQQNTTTYFSHLIVTLHPLAILPPPHPILCHLF